MTAPVTHNGNGSRPRPRARVLTTTPADGPVGMAVIGAGYWGPNIVRNAMAFGGTELKWVCDRDVGRARHVVGEQSSIRVTPDIDDILADESVEAVAIATPPATHAELALRCIDGGPSPARREAARGLLRRRAGDGQGRGRAGRRPALRPHVLLHAGGPEDP